MTAPRPPLGMRRGLGHLSSGLIAYGVVGLLVAAIGFGALFWVGGRFGRISTSAEASVSQMAGTMERTADALHDASRTATTFSTTLDQAVTSLPSISQELVATRTELGSLEVQLRSVNIFGSAPLSNAADAVGRIAASLQGLETQLALAGVALAANRDALKTNATSLGLLGDSTAASAARLRSGVIEDSVDDVRLVVMVMLFVFTALSVVPAVGALVLGLWLRREMERPEDPALG